jgi:cobalamin synthase
VKFAALTHVLQSDHRLLLVVAVPAVARWAAVMAARTFSSARPGGMGDVFRAGLDARAVPSPPLLALAAAAPLLWLALWCGRRW